MRYCAFIILIISWCTVNICGQIPGFDLLDNKSKKTIYCELVGNYWVVNVIYGGWIPMKFIIDTGSDNIILFEKEYIKLGNYQLDKQLLIYGANLESAMKAWVSRRNLLKIGNLDEVERDLIVLSDANIDFESMIGVKIHGILGARFFQNLVVEFKYDRQKITVYHPHKFTLKDKDYKELKAKFDGEKIYVPSELYLYNKIQINTPLLFDTGSGLSILINSNASEFFGQLPNEELGLLGNGISGEIMGHIGDIEAFKLGEYGVVSPTIYVQRLDNVKDTEGKKFRNGSVGGEILNNFNFVIDYYRQKLYLKKNKSFNNSKKSVKNLSGLDIRTYGQDLDKHFIFYVYPGSPAHKAGLRRNDLIYKINRNHASQSDLNAIKKWINKENNKKVKLIVYRENQELEFEYIPNQWMKKL